MKYPISLFILIFVFLGCKKELPYPDVEKKDLIVVNGLLNPNNDPIIHLSQTCHITELDCEQHSLLNAQVFLKDESGNSLVELLHSENGIYVADDFQVNSNKQYSIEVASTGLETVTAKTTTPNSFNCHLIGKNEEIYQKYICRTFKIEIEDNPNEANYYLINGWVDILNGQHSDDQEFESNGYIFPHTGFLTRDVNAENNTMIAGLDIIPYPLDFIFLKDENFNGQTYELEFGLHDFDLSFDPDWELEAHIYVKSVNKEVYDYFKSITNYKLTRGNPFSEPHQIFSNIENGVGIFGGITQHEIIEPLPQTEFWLPFNGDFIAENEGCTGPCTVQFNVEMGNGINQFWDFGDGNTSTEKNPEHEYQNSGEFIVSLTLELGNSTWQSSRPIVIN